MLGISKAAAKALGLTAAERTYINRLNTMRRYYASPKGRVYVKHHRRKRQARAGGYEPLHGRVPAKPNDGRCECCRRVRPLTIDHCHVSGFFRGWLCRLCNQGIGALGDDLRGVLHAVAYLRLDAHRFDKKNLTK